MTDNTTTATESTDETDDADNGRIAQLTETVAAIVNSSQALGGDPGVEQIPDVSAEYAETLREAGFETVGDVADADQARIAAVDGITKTNAMYLQHAAAQTRDMYPPSDGGETATETDASTLSVSDETVATVAAAADVSEAEARAVIEHAAQTGDLSVPTEDETPPAVADPALRTYAADLIAPASLKLSPTTAQTSDVYTKTIYVEGYPEYARPRMVEQLFSDADHVDVDVSIHVESHDRLSAIGHLRDAIEDLEVRVAQKDDSSDVTIRDSVRRLDAHEDVYDQLSTGNDDAFDVGFYIILRADDRDRVTEAAGDIETALKTRQLTVKPADYEQQEGLVAGSPLAEDPLDRTTTMLGGAVGTMFPFSSTSLIEPSGVLMGYHALTDAPIVMDRYERSSYNMVVVGQLGAGKSFNIKLNLLRRLARDPETIVIIIDPRGDFDDLVETLDGHRITVDGSCALNPLEIEAPPEHVVATMDADEYDPFKQARSSAMDMFDSYFAMHASDDDAYTTEQRSILQFALNIAYALHGITRDPATHSNSSPTIPEVRAVLGAISRTPEPYIRLDTTGTKITPEVVGDLPGLDIDQHQVTGAPATSTATPDGGVAPASISTPDDDLATAIPEKERERWEQHATSLKIALQPFGPGGTLEHLGQPTEIDIADSNVVYLDLAANDTDTGTSLMMKVLFNAIYERAKTTDKRVIMPIDEAWRLIKDSQSLTWLEQGTRFSRHHDLSIQFITQQLDEFYSNDDAKAIIDNCMTKLLLRLKEVTDAQATSLGLSEREINYITSATAGESHGKYAQGLLMVEEEGKYPLRIEALPEEVPLIDPEAAEQMDLSHGGDAP
jgi:hypothetical protein